MREINLTFANFGNRVIPLGVKGENYALQIKIDCTEALADVASGHPALALVAPDGTAYPGEIYVSNGTVLWLVRSRDTEQAGRGTARLDIINARGVTVKSVNAITNVEDTIDSGDLPTQVKDWLDASSATLLSVKQALLNVDSAADNAKDISERAETLLKQLIAQASTANTLINEAVTFADDIVKVSETKPESKYNKIWLNPDNESLNIPEIKDDETSAVDTWSSQKIQSEIATIWEKLNTL